MARSAARTGSLPSRRPANTSQHLGRRPRAASKRGLLRERAHDREADALQPVVGRGRDWRDPAGPRRGSRPRSRPADVAGTPTAARGRRPYACITTLLHASLTAVLRSSSSSESSARSRRPAQRATHERQRLGPAVEVQTHGRPVVGHVISYSGLPIVAVADQFDQAFWPKFLGSTHVPDNRPLKRRFHPSVRAGPCSPRWPGPGAEDPRVRMLAPSVRDRRGLAAHEQAGDRGHGSRSPTVCSPPSWASRLLAGRVSGFSSSRSLPVA